MKNETTAAWHAYRIVRRILLPLKLDVVWLRQPADARVQPLLRRILSERSMLLNSCEALQLAAAVDATSRIPGDIAEIGAFQGGSTKLICETKGDRTLHVFDTFEGLPAQSSSDTYARLRKGQYASSLDSVSRYLASYPNVFLHKGVFPGTASAVESRTFSLLHLDVDLYEPTHAALKFFYPRLQRGGIIISHDYVLDGVRKAFDEFFGERIEPVIPLSGGTQCLVVKIGKTTEEVGGDQLSR